MSYITLANAKKILLGSNISNLNLQGEIYKVKIYFFSKYEENSLLAIKELLKDPENYFKNIYKPYEARDTYRYIYEGRKPAYHKYATCQRLNSDYQNFEIPEEISARGPEVVQEFREWFETVKHLLARPDVFVMRLQAKWGIVTNPLAINIENSGNTFIDNFTIDEIEETIDNLLKEAGRFYRQSEKNKEILRQYAKYAYLAKKNQIYNNHTQYSDKEVKELLEYYDDEFKTPLKKYLILYYRLKFNPEIKMEGYFLDLLGFNACSLCHDEKYVPHYDQNQSSLNIPPFDSFDDVPEDDLPF